MASLHITEPRPRKDNLCACGCGKPRAQKPVGRGYASAMQYEKEPFATRACCERFYGIEDREHGEKAV